MTIAETFESWAIVELMGHRKRPGFAKEVEIAGGKMLRIDIPVTGAESVTEYYGVASIYSIRPATEEVVRDLIANSYGADPRPVRPVSYRPQVEIASDPDPDDLRWEN